MRVLHVVPSFYPAWAYGGIPRCAYELCRALVRLGVDVTAWTTDAYDALRRLPEATATADGITIRRFPNLSNRLAYHRQLYVPRGLRAYAPRHVGEFDVVHLHSHRHLLQPLVANPARRAGIPYVFTGNGTVPSIERYLSAKRLVDVLGARTFLQHAAACIAVSQAETAHYRAAGVRPERIRVIPNGIRLEEFATLPARGAFRRGHGLGDCAARSLRREDHSTQRCRCLAARAEHDAGGRSAGRRRQLHDARATAAWRRASVSASGCGSSGC